MKNIIRQEYPWFLAHATWFWILPLVASLFEPADQTGVLLLLLMIANPLFCILCALFYGMRNGRKWSFLIYPVIAIAASIPMYYNSSAIGFGLIALICSVIGLIFGGWSRARKMSEAEKWQLKQAAELVKKEKTEPAPTYDQTVRVASKTAAKNQQKAYARKAKERAEKEAKRQNKSQPQKKKKKGGH